MDRAVESEVASALSINLLASLASPNTLEVGLVEESVEASVSFTTSEVQKKEEKTSFEPNISLT